MTRDTRDAAIPPHAKRKGLVAAALALTLTLALGCLAVLCHHWLRERILTPQLLERSLADGSPSIRWQLWLGADVNAVEPKTGFTPLVMAVLFEKPRRVDELLKAGANPTMVDRNGQSPLDVAVQLRHARILERLIEAAPSKAQDAGVWRPAVASEDPALVRLMLSYGLSPNAIDQDGQTPLMIASFGENPECVRLLLEAKANPNFRDADGWTAWDHACVTKNPAIKRLLRSHGAAISGKQPHHAGR